MHGGLPALGGLCNTFLDSFCQTEMIANEIKWTHFKLLQTSECDTTDHVQELTTYGNWNRIWLKLYVHQVPKFQKKKTEKRIGILNC